MESFVLTGRASTVFRLLELKTEQEAKRIIAEAVEKQAKLNDSINAKTAELINAVEYITGKHIR